MKTVKSISISGFFFLLSIFTSCTDNPRNDDPNSTMTPGGNLTVDSATAHANNMDSAIHVKKNNADSTTSHGINKNTDTTGKHNKISKG
jgi:hypothetical protein